MARWPLSTSRAGGRAVVGRGHPARHHVWAGIDLLRCDLSDLFRATGYLTGIGDYVGAHPDTEWVLGSGWSMSAFPGGTRSAATGVTPPSPTPGPAPTSP